MKRLRKDAYYCEKCGEVYKVDGDKQTPVEDKKKFFADMKEAMNDFGKYAKGLFEKFCPEEKKEGNDLEGEYFA